jgi:hypothetical protein
MSKAARYVVRQGLVSLGDPREKTCGSYAEAKAAAARLRDEIIGMVAAWKVDEKRSGDLDLWNAMARYIEGATFGRDIAMYVARRAVTIEKIG